MEMGSTGTFISSASTKPPFLKGRSAPSRLRVPSGAIQTSTPSSSFARASPRLRMAASRLRRSTKMKPEARIAAPHTGTLASSTLETMRSRWSITWKITGMS